MLCGRSGRGSGFLVALGDGPHVSAAATRRRGAPILEGYVALGAMAAVTKRVEIGTLVTGVTYRNPAHLAKQIATLDTLTGGSAILRISGKARRVFHIRLGLSVGEGTTRPTARGGHHLPRHVRQRDVQLQWRLLHGHRCARCAPARTPHTDHDRWRRREEDPRMVAEMADICNIGGTANVVQHWLAILDEHCAALGRDPRDVKRTAMASLFSVGKRR